jgi:hypothetical protein
MGQLLETPPSLPLPKIISVRESNRQGRGNLVVRLLRADCRACQDPRAPAEGISTSPFCLEMPPDAPACSFQCCVTPVRDCHSNIGDVHPGSYVIARLLAHPSPRRNIGSCRRARNAHFAEDRQRSRCMYVHLLHYDYWVLVNAKAIRYRKRTTSPPRWCFADFLEH